MLRAVRTRWAVVSMIAGLGCAHDDPGGRREPPDSWLVAAGGGSRESTPTMIAMLVFARAKPAAIHGCLQLEPELQAGARLSFRMVVQPSGEATDFEILEEERRGRPGAICVERELRDFRWPSFDGEPHSIEFFFEVPRDFRSE